MPPKKSKRNNTIHFGMVATKTLALVALFMGHASAQDFDAMLNDLYNQTDTNGNGACLARPWCRCPPI